MKILSLVLLTVFIQSAVAQIKIVPVDMDEAFKTGPEVFRRDATQLWKKNILEKF